MAKRLTREEFLRNLRDSRLLSPEEIDASLASNPELPGSDGEALADELVAAGKLTPYQLTSIRERQFEGLVIGNYLVLDRIGTGGMGTVYKALHRRMKRVVAVKVLSRNVGKSETFVQRFQREVEAVSRLSHPNIVMAHDADEAEVGNFLVMEFVNGRDLSTEVRQRGPLPVFEAVDDILQAAQALDYAHRQGIIHRDIKPANLLHDISGVIKVADLGLARFNDKLIPMAEELSALTQAGTIMGTIDYMSPEQSMGLPDIDQRADIYSLGCTLFYLLIGRPPYQGSTLMAILLEHREAPIPLLTALRAEVPVALDQIFRRMVAKQPEDRFTSMHEVIRSLEALVSQSKSSLSSGAKKEMETSSVSGNISGKEETVLAKKASAAMDKTVDFRSGVRPSLKNKVILNKTVLLAEPSRSQAVIIRDYLLKLGFENVYTVTSGQAALEQLAKVPTRVVISAMHLSDMTGVQLMQNMRARETFSSVGFILITSQTDAQDVSLLSQAGNMRCLIKPFAPEQLSEVLKSVTGERRQQNAPVTGNARAQLNVLVAEDSNAARTYIRGVLQGLGLNRISEVTNGAEAVDLLEREDYDLVITDYTMPFLDGRGLIEFIRHRSRKRDVPVIVVTSETDPAKLAAIRQLGVSAVCGKNFDPRVVRSIVEKLE